MPDHVHLVLLPCETKGSISLGRIIGELKSISARSILHHLRSVEGFDVGYLTRKDESVSFWQRRFYDHNCRSAEIVIEKINYCHNNPVVRVLVDKPEKWQWSSFKWYAGETDVPIEMDELQ